MNIWILEGDSGRTMFFKSIRAFPMDEILVSGFLTALNQFIMSEFRRPVESIEMGGFRWIYIQDTENNLMFVASDTKDIDADTLKMRLRLIKQSFTEEFVIKQNIFTKRWTGDTMLFESFIRVFEEYYYQWTAAEGTISLAECFDILGMCQQILNIVRKVIDKKVDDALKEQIYEKIEKLFHDFTTQDHILGHEELKKISYSRKSGFNIISINPAKCDIMMIKVQIIWLIKEVVSIIRGEIGYGLTLDYLGKEKIFNYLFSNIVILRRHNLDTLILELFLLV
jgi:hypothetical protein